MLKRCIWGSMLGLFFSEHEKMKGLCGDIFIQDTGDYKIFQEPISHQEEPYFLLHSLLKVC